MCEPKAVSYTTHHPVCVDAGATVESVLHREAARLRRAGKEPGTVYITSKEMDKRGWYQLESIGCIWGFEIKRAKVPEFPPPFQYTHPWDL